MDIHMPDNPDDYPAPGQMGFITVIRCRQCLKKFEGRIKGARAAGWKRRNVVGWRCKECEAAARPKPAPDPDDEPLEPYTGPGKPRGLAAVSRSKRRKIAAMGGRARAALGVGHTWTPEEAREHGRRAVELRKQRKEQP